MCNVFRIQRHVLLFRFLPLGTGRNVEKDLLRQEWSFGGTKDSRKAYRMVVATYFSKSGIKATKVVRINNGEWFMRW